MSDINGVVEDGWGPVADVFRANFKDGKDLGGAFCVYVDGRPVVDLWGGVADRETNRPWDRDTVVAVASTTKGAAAICAHLLAQRGQLDLDAPVIRYWPEFGAAGKEDVPVRWLLSHQVGLPIVDVPLTFKDVCAWDPVIRALEAQKPLWTPGTEHLYHAMTYGYLVGEVVRRITGKSLGTFFAEEVAGPLGLSAWIGLPEEMEPRVAPTEVTMPAKPADMAGDFAALMGFEPAVAAAVVKEVYGPGSVFSKAGTMGGADWGDVFASRAWRAAESPGANMFANAHAIARMYAATVSEVDGIRLLQPDTVAKMTELQTDRTRMHGVPQELLPYTKNLFKMSLGFFRPSLPAAPMLGPASFGHPGSGGSLGAGDPEARVGFGYTPNRWPIIMIDPRAIELTAACEKAPRLV